MKLLNLLPVTAKGVVTEAMMKTMTQYLGSDTAVDTDQIEQGALTIESEAEEVRNSAQVLDLAKKAWKDYDGIFVNCFGDPGVRATRECVDIPVFGGFEPAVHIALGLGDRIGIISVLNNVIPMLRNSIAKAHLDGRIVCVRSINIPVLDLADSAKMCGALIAEADKAIREDGIEVVVLGCTGMAGEAETVRDGLLKLGHDIPVLDPSQCSLMMLELYAKMGLKQSRITYMPPPK